MKDTLKFYHIRRDGKKGKAGHSGILTVATKIEDGNVKIGLAFCSPHDNFEKAKGRMIAIGQMDSRPLFTKFTGNSANDLVRLWTSQELWDMMRIKDGKSVSRVPQIWQGSRLTNIEQTGLTVLNKI